METQVDSLSSLKDFIPGKQILTKGLVIFLQVDPYILCFLPEFALGEL